MLETTVGTFNPVAPLGVSLLAATVVVPSLALAVVVVGAVVVSPAAGFVVVSPVAGVVVSSPVDGVVVSSPVPGVVVSSEPGVVVVSSGFLTSALITSISARPTAVVDLKLRQLRLNVLNFFAFAKTDFLNCTIIWKFSNFKCCSILKF